MAMWSTACQIIFVLVFWSVGRGDLPHNCLDVQQTLTSSNKTDGEYILYLQQNVGVSVYCSGMKSNSPKEYLTLRAGRSNNFAIYYQYQGNPDSCGKSAPAQVYGMWGRTEFIKLRLYPDTLAIDINDFTFTHQIGPNKICYGCAGDKFAQSLKCTPKGNFKIDLSGTPFVVSTDIQWTWRGQYSSPKGSTNGLAFIANYTYIGCFIDDRVRLLPSAMMQDKHKMTPTLCISHCRAKGFRYAGVEYGLECHCGDSHDRYAMSSHDSDCNTKCAGNNQQSCGGVWKISVYATGQDQVVSGNCGGFPGSCFPAHTSTHMQPALSLTYVTKQPCLQGVCQNEANCIALSEHNFKCICQAGFVGPLCDQLQSFINVDGSDCPAGMQPEQCSCASNCAGARFEADSCTTTSGKPQVTCRYGDIGFVFLYNQGPAKSSVSCPSGTDIVGCSVWDTNTKRMHGKGTGVMDTAHRKCSISGCSTCTVQARCKQYLCGCMNGGTCSKVTGACTCPLGYYGDHCESFDYCSFYEDHNNATACKSGTCMSVPERSVRAYGGDNAGDHCIFPFTMSGLTFTSCIESNQVGPPFACGAQFDGNDDYIDIAPWNPGPVYTIAAWVNPAIGDTRRRTIVGGVTDCRDFGLAMQNGQFIGYYYPPTGKPCTANLVVNTKYSQGQWYLLAVANNGTNTFVYLNGKQVATSKSRPYYLPTSLGFRIGSSVCCKGENFKGMIKSVKIWKRYLGVDEVTQSMSVAGSVNSTIEAQFSGLVAHFELGQGLEVDCSGTDHHGADWTVNHNDILSGSHCNVSQFFVPKGVTAYIKKYDGTSGGFFKVYAATIKIDGYLNGLGAGYRGGARPNQPSENGKQGESYNGIGKASTAANKGGGGGGAGGNADPQGYGRPGAGGGYGSVGKPPVKRSNGGGGWSAGGAVYGNYRLAILYMGSGGGSGGNAKDLSRSPKGGKGGNGGPSVFLYATGNIRVTGSVSVAGENGQGDALSQTGCSGCPSACKASSSSNCVGSSTSACWDTSGPGGGGSGGSLYITGNVVDVGHNRLWANGGKGGYGGKGGCGGDGGIGRIQINAAIFKGYISRSYGAYNVNNAKQQYIDYSIPGQRMIKPQETVVGNEIYRGCYSDVISKRHFAYTVPLTKQQQGMMTPDFCIAMCRQKGYQYSGVEYGHECFCDNEFDWNKKKPDSDCNMQCSGDSLQLCGASYRMAVYGPRPQVPGEGFNGVTSTCTSWCVTADAFSSQPKTGLCDLSSQKSTSWKIFCECSPGFSGADCDQGCTNNTWGKNCRNSCNCNINNTVTCNPIDGQCDCKPGFTGDQCSQVCPSGTFGHNCQGKCNCLETAICDPTSGNCICKAGWMGGRCSIPCSPGLYGANCTQKCNCYQGSCSPEDGTCDCDPGYKLPFCAELCDPGDYGPSCLYICDCNYQDCDPRTGVCQCGPGLTGEKCEQHCPFGTYGQNCAQSCNCLQGASCDSVTGMCNCPSGYVGATCNSKCSAWKYGLNCLQTCSCVQANTASCDAATGRCYCKPGYKGFNCSTPCPNGYYGQDCTSTCACSGGSPCNPVSGTCQCNPGLVGATCTQTCPSGHYGSGCSSICPTCSAGFCSVADGTCICQSGSCKCPKGLWGPQCTKLCSCLHGGCDSQTGACVCDPGWTGTTCNTACKQGRYGPGCKNQCSCVNAACDVADGTCNCTSGYAPPTCANQCPSGKYGPNCQLTCGRCGSRSTGCDPVTGTCLCTTGYSGLSCDQPCPKGMYGDGCAQTCRCQHGACDTVSGACLCDAGYTGPTCNQPCYAGSWGDNCSHSCDCGPHSINCDLTTGLCNCKPGFQGVKCRQSCDQGSYGAGCSQTCQCDLTKSQCSPLDGSCECLPGYLGSTCTQSCPSGKWGRGCQQDCLCSNHGNCSFTDGTCDCLPGYTGKTCNQACKQDVFWGKNCANICKCNGQHCDHVTGSCQCPPGKKGPQCKQGCDGNHFGLDCAQQCQCSNRAACDPVTGTCHCTQGWTGDNCDQKCPVGRFGDGCMLTCNCKNGGACDSLTGVCMCSPGYTGTDCSQTCRAGRWGPNCSQRCSAACRASCLSDTGVCRCQPWTCMNGGTCGSDGRCMCTLGWSGDTCGTGQGRDLASIGNNIQFVLTTGQLIGVVIAFLAILVLAVAGMGFFMKRRSTRLANIPKVNYSEDKIAFVSEDFNDPSVTNEYATTGPNQFVTSTNTAVDEIASNKNESET